MSSRDYFSYRRIRDIHVHESGYNYDWESKMSEWFKNNNTRILYEGSDEEEILLKRVDKMNRLL